VRSDLRQCFHQLDTEIGMSGISIARLYLLHPLGKRGIGGQMGLCGHGRLVRLTGPRRNRQ
jgi:hypothetical protein